MTFELEFDSADLARLQRALNRLDVEHLAKPMFSLIGTTIAQETRVRPNWTDQPPPYPYWIRGKGWQYASGRNDMSSQNSYNMGHGGGNQGWYVNVYPDYLKVGNYATYAGYLHGPEQADVHKRHGWRKLLETAMKEMPGIIRKLEAQALKVWEGGK